MGVITDDEPVPARAGDDVAPPHAVFSGEQMVVSATVYRKSLLMPGRTRRQFLHAPATIGPA